MTNQTRRSIRTVERRNLQQGITNIELQKLFSTLIDAINNPHSEHDKHSFNRTCHITSGQKTFLFEMITVIFSIAAGYIYIDPSMKYADSEQPFLPYFQELTELIGHENVRIFTAACVSIPAVSMLYMSMMNFVSMQQAKIVPEDLKEILHEEMTDFMVKIRYGLIILGSLLSSLPLSSLVISYEKNIYEIITFFLISLGANTILHLLPFELMLTRIGYRWPIEIIKKPIEFIRFLLKPKHERYFEALEAQKIKDSNEIKNYILEVLTKSHANYCLKVMEFNPWCLHYKILHLDRQKLEFDNLFPCNNNQDEKENILVRSLKYINNKIPNGPLQLLGGLESTFSCTGYLLNPFNLLNKTLRNSIYTAAAVAVPTYALAILVFFFGTGTIDDLKNFLFNWGKYDIKIPLEGKLHFRKFIVYFLTAMIIASYSDAAGLQLLNDNMKFLNSGVWENFKLSLIICTIVGITFVSFNIMQMLFKNVVRKYSAYSSCVSDLEKNLITYDEKVEQIKRYVSIIKPGYLESAISEAGDEIVNRVTGHSRHECLNILNSTKKMEDKMTKGWFSRIYSYFYKPTQDEESVLLKSSRNLNLHLPK